VSSPLLSSGLLLSSRQTTLAQIEFFSCIGSLSCDQILLLLTDLLKYDRIMVYSRGKQVIHTSTPTLLYSAGARGQHRCNTRLGGWTQINIKERNRGVIIRRSRRRSHSGYMLRFTQEHACLRISTKPVDMSEKGPQTPQHPPKVTHRPGRTWGNLIKQKEGAGKISTE